MLWNTGTVMVEQCGGTVKQLLWNSVVEQWNSLGERWNSHSGQCCGTVEQLWWNSVGGTGLVEQ